jgi:LmbE family N-acetylglucosaminyl deacetylase
VLKRTLLLCCAVAALHASPPRLGAQAAPARGIADLAELVEGLGTTSRVLMIGAHPDDEDTQLIAYLAKARHIETAYLSLTRGDGGQNLIGNELGPMLGMIRTEELLAARRIDGGRQYFTRAFDFGFSKTIDETYQHWPKDSILKDMVAIVRAFRPHVIIAVWSGTPADGHGHHQYAGVLARAVFDAAADSIHFPAARLGGLTPWAPAKFYRLRRGAAGSLTFNVGEFDPLLGESYSEIATVSRSQHRSQGQGDLPRRGPRFTGVQLEASRVSDPKTPEHTLFDGLDTSWARFRSLSLPAAARAALDSLDDARASVVRQRDLTAPERLVAPLAAVVRLTQVAASEISCTTLDVTDRRRRPACDPAMGDLALALATTHTRASEALLDAGGVAIEATVPRELVAVGDTIPVTATVYNQGKTNVGFFGVTPLGRGQVAGGSPSIPPDSSGRISFAYRADAISSPWWLRRPLNGDMFTQPLAEMILGEDRVYDSGVDVDLSAGGTRLTVRRAPIVHRYADAALGEVRRPLAAVPEISVLLEHEVEYARAGSPFDRTYRVNVRSASTQRRDVDVTLRLPAGLAADSATRRISLAAMGEGNLYFRVTGRLSAGRDSIVATARSHGEAFDLGYVPIQYEHIRPLRAFRRSTVQIEAVNATFAANMKIGYIRGVGDNVMPMLEELGLSVTELDPALLPRTNLSGFTTIVLGSRAYEANPSAMVAATPLLLQFARNGGTIVTQYGHAEIAQPGLLPLPISLNRTGARVTDENAVVRVLDPGSPLLSTPNRIVEGDFANWVQERTLYMPQTFDPQWRRVFSMNDPGEPPNDAAVLIAPVGKGTYVFTTFAFFRQLPAGNPGAARLFINLLSADRRSATRPMTPLSTPPRP